MKKTQINKLLKIFGKLYTLDLELTEILSELEAERDKAEKKFDEINELYDNADDPSDSLQNRLDNADEAFENANDDCDYIDDIVAEIDNAVQSLIDILPADEVDEMKKEIEAGKKMNTPLPKKDIKTKKVYSMTLRLDKYVNHPESGTYYMKINFSTDLQPKPQLSKWQWNGTDWIKVDDGAKMPYLNDEAMKLFEEQKNQIMNSIWENRKIQGNCNLNFTYD